MKYFLLSLIFSSFSWASVGPSFECKKAKTKVEKSICKNKRLSGLDHLMSTLYKTWFADAQRQKQWLKSRNQCSEPKMLECLERSYMDRVLKLFNEIIKNEDAIPGNPEPLTIHKLKWKGPELLVLFENIKYFKSAGFYEAKLNLAKLDVDEGGIGSWFQVTSDYTAVQNMKRVCQYTISNNCDLTEQVKAFTQSEAQASSR